MRETKTITLPTGLKVEVISWINGREKRQILNAMTEGIEFDSQGNAQGLTTELLTKQEDRIIELCVVSIDGEKEGLLDKVLDMKVEDYEFLIEELKNIVNLNQEKKTK